MEKKIALNLSKNDEFFVNLKQYFLEEANLAGYDISPNLDKVILGTLTTLKSMAIQQGNQGSDKVKITFKDEEYINPDFYHEMEEDIDAALNRRIHSTTLERIVDAIVEFMNEYADMQAKAKEIKVPALVDPNHELKAITQYMQKTWDGFEKVDAEAFFTKIWDNCVEKTKNKFDQHAFTDLVRSWSEERKDYENWKNAGTKITEKDFANKLDDDEVKNLPMLILLEIMNLGKKVKENWDYEDIVDGIVSKIKKDFPDASKLRPKGWKEMKKTYEDYDGQAEFDSKKAREEFGGMYSGTAGASSFEVRVGLPYVMYDDTNQGRKPLEVLIGAMLGHAYVMNEQNNASAMLRELLELKAKYDQPEYYQQPVTEVNFDFKVPLNKQMFIMINQDNPNILKEYGEQKIAAKRQKHLKKSNKP